MIASVETPDEITKTFLQSEKLLWKLVHDFVKVYGGDRDELFSAAQMAFLRAYKKFDPNKCCWIPYLIYCVKNSLRDVWKKNRKRLENEISFELTCLDKYKNVSRFKVSDYSKDAQTVMGLSLEAPIESNRYRVRDAIKRHLRSVGWTLARVTETFSEVRKAVR